MSQNLYKFREGLSRKKLSKSWHCQEGGGESDPCQDYFGGFDTVHRGQPKVIMDPQKGIFFPQKVTI